MHLFARCQILTFLRICDLLNSNHSRPSELSWTISLPTSQPCLRSTLCVPWHILALQYIFISAEICNQYIFSKYLHIWADTCVSICSYTYIHVCAQECIWQSLLQSIYECMYVCANTFFLPSPPNWCRFTFHASQYYSLVCAPWWCLPSSWISDFAFAAFLIT